MSEQITEQTPSTKKSFKDFPIIGTFVTSWRELVALLLFGFGVGWIADWVAVAGIGFGDVTGFAFLDRFMKGFSTFASVMCAGGILGLFLWPTVAKYGNADFKKTWETLNDKTKLGIYLGVYFVSCLIAAICFAVK